MATIQLELGQPDDAIEILSKVEEQTPHDGQLLALLARAHLQAERTEEAQAYLEKAAEGLDSKDNSSEPLGTEQAWEFKHCGSLVHYCPPLLVPERVSLRASADQRLRISTSFISSPDSRETSWVAAMP